MIGDMESKSKSIVFGLCYFHSVLTERKKFGAKGFNMMYPFSLGDLRDSSICLLNYMENAPSKIPWEDLKYIFGQIIYGGHIVRNIFNSSYILWYYLFDTSSLSSSIQYFFLLFFFLQ